MPRCILALTTLLILAGWSVAQPAPQSSQGPGPDQPPPRSDQQKSIDRDAEAHQSSSRDTRVDLSPPRNDAKDHPNSGVARSGNDANPEDATADVQEMHPFNPYRAGKDNEVGDYYFKRKNYKAALARYQDALIYKDHDAVANFRMAQCYEKLNQPAEAIAHYQEYLRILPNGEFSKDARKAVEKLGAPEKKSAISQKPEPLH
jgi:tetratricopeptide (TPR) repeat protein